MIKGDRCGQVLSHGVIEYIRADEAGLVQRRAGVEVSQLLDIASEAGSLK